MSTVTENTVNQRTFLDGKTVYYSTSYEQYLRLKRLHGILLRAWTDHKRLARWQNKTVHRKGPQPGHNEAVSKIVNGHPCFFIPGFTLFGKDLYLKVLESYRLARIPHATPNTAVPPYFPWEWENFLNSFPESN